MVRLDFFDTQRIIEAFRKSQERAPNYFLLEKALRHVYGSSCRFAKLEELTEFMLDIENRPVAARQATDDRSEPSCSTSYYWHVNHLFPLAKLRIDNDMTVSYILSRIRNLEHFQDSREDQVGTMRVVTALHLSDDEPSRRVVERIVKVIRRYALLELTEGGVDNILAKYRNELMVAHGIFGVLLMATTSFALAITGYSVGSLASASGGSSSPLPPFILRHPFVAWPLPLLVLLVWIGWIVWTKVRETNDIETLQGVLGDPRSPLFVD